MSNSNEFHVPRSAENNPYQSSLPPTRIGLDSPADSATSPTTMRLASLSQRFFGWLIDTLLPLLFFIPGLIPLFFTVVNLIRQEQANPGREVQLDPASITMLVLGTSIIGIGSIITLVLQIVLLWTRSQTVGKYLVKSQVVDFESGKPADFLSCGVLRIFVNGLISGLPCVGMIYGIADTLFILRDDRRCIHDLIASTTVIDISDHKA
jgi:uncharacterized RDD family membrane protein YckC